MSDADPETKPLLLLCDCEGTADALADPERTERLAAGIGCRAGKPATQLCGKQLSALEAALAAPGDAPVIAACAQEAALFEELAAEMGAEERLLTLDLRDRAGWSEAAGAAEPKMAALLAEARLPRPAAPALPIESAGVILVLGAPDVALPAAERLAGPLAPTCLLSDAPEDPPPLRSQVGVALGRLRSAAGGIGGFEVVVDDYRERLPGGRGGYRFADPVKGARSACDLILDLTGAAPLFPAPEKRDGYLRADPGDRLAVERAVFEAAQLVGAFDKPLYIRFEQSLCAHSRAGQPGCDRCLSLCPTGAITVGGVDGLSETSGGAGPEHVSIDPLICAGCGACAAVCPTGAASYDDPPAAHLTLRLRTLAEAFRKAGGAAPRLLVHDAEHGAEMIGLAARYGRGLPAEVIPFALEETGSFGHAQMVAALASGFGQVWMLAGPKTERAALDGQVALAEALATGVGAEGRIGVLEPADPDALSDALYDAAPVDAALSAPILAVGEGRALVRTALTALAGGDAPEQPISLEGVTVAGGQAAGAPYGAVLVDQGSCTLCLSCVSLCPTGALSDNEDKPELNFQEDACIQCGICASACPEEAIALKPQMDLTTAALSRRVLHEEEPFACISCGKLFGVKSTIERVMEKLAGKHWMFTASDNHKLIMMCDDCRVQTQFHGDGAPFQLGTPRRPRTTEDDLAEREAAEAEAKLKDRTEH